MYIKLWLRATRNTKPAQTWLPGVGKDSCTSIVHSAFQSRWGFSFSRSLASSILSAWSMEYPRILLSLFMELPPGPKVRLLPRSDPKSKSLLPYFSAQTVQTFTPFSISSGEDSATKSDMHILKLPELICIQLEILYIYKCLITFYD